jgi:hypothetical protein
VNSWKVILATMVIFGTGVVTGGLLVKYAVPGRDRHSQHSSPNVRPAQLTPAGLMRLDFLRRIERDLVLTPEQHEAIDKLVKDGQERTKKIIESIEPRRREEYKKTMEQFRAILTPAQRTRFDELVKQQQQRTREQRKNAPSRERPAQKPPAAERPAGTNS